MILHQRDHQTYEDTIDESSHHFTEYTGTGLASFKHHFKASTKSLFLRDKDTNKTYALTCRHVVFGNSDVNTQYQHDDTHFRTVIQPGQVTFNELTEEFEEKYAAYTEAVRLRTSGL